MPSIRGLDRTRCRHLKKKTHHQCKLMEKFGFLMNLTKEGARGVYTIRLFFCTFASDIQDVCKKGNMYRSMLPN